MNTLSRLTLLASVVVPSSSFAPHTERSRAASKNELSSPSSIASSSSLKVSANPRGVDRVSICMGDLCRCQEEDNADFIMEELMSMELPYVVEDAPCLGACGQGSMVSIDYEDGDFALVTGLDETLDAIGVTRLRNDSHDTVENIDKGVKDSENMSALDASEETELVTALVNEAVENLEDIPNAQIQFTKDESGKKNQPLSVAQVSVGTTSKEKVIEEHGAVERMRNEASKDEEVENPWVKMAFYIGKKVIGGKD